MMLIGPKPTDVPAFVLPFKAVSDEVRDANGKFVAQLNLDDYGQDTEMAQAIADALNEKFGEKPEPEENAEVFDTGSGDPKTARAVWVVVDGLAYFETYDNRDYEQSTWTVSELRDPEEFTYLGRKRVDPADLADVVGTP